MYHIPNKTLKQALYTLLLIIALFLTGCANAGKDQKVISEQIVILDGTQSSPDFFGKIKKYKWKQVKAREKGNKYLKVTLLDNMSASPSFIAPTVSKETTLTFKLVTTEKDGMYSPWHSRDSVDVLVSPKVTTNTPLEAKITTSSTTVKEGNSVTFDASTSSDSDGQIVAYKWKDVQGTVLSQEVSFEHTFATLGEQTLTLSVTDDGGETATTTVTVNVVALQKPQADIHTSASTIFINNTVSFDASASSDEDGQIVSYTWKDTQGSILSNQVSFTHTFAVSGEHNITLEVLDDDGQLSTASVAIVVQAHLTSLTLSIEESTLEVNQTTTLTAIAHYNDNTNQEISSSVTWEVTDTTLVIIDANGTLKALDSGTTNIVAKIGNIDSNSVTLEVLGLDTAPPILTLNGEAKVTLFLGTVYSELGARATDDIDENVTITQSGTVDTNSVGTYTLTYAATDKAGNSATVQRTVHVVLPPDVTAPVITLNGDSTVTLFQGANYTELGATATDDRDANVSVSISGTVDSATLGTYIMTYTATDTVGNSASIERIINVVLPPDTEAPVITLNGDVNITLTLGESYEELGAIAYDQRDGDVNVTISGSVDSSIEGTYSITYTARDKVDNTIQVTRTVTVVSQVEDMGYFVESNETEADKKSSTIQLSVNLLYDKNLTFDLKKLQVCNDKKCWGVIDSITHKDVTNHIKKSTLVADKIRVVNLGLFNIYEMKILDSLCDKKSDTNDTCKKKINNFMIEKSIDRIKFVYNGKKGETKLATEMLFSWFANSLYIKLDERVTVPFNDRYNNYVKNELHIPSVAYRHKFDNGVILDIPKGALNQMAFFRIRGLKGWEKEQEYFAFHDYSISFYGERADATLYEVFEAMERGYALSTVPKYFLKEIGVYLPLRKSSISKEELLKEFKFSNGNNQGYTEDFEIVTIENESYVYFMTNLTTFSPAFRSK